MKKNKKIVIFTLLFMIAVVSITTGIILSLKGKNNENSTMNALLKEEELYGVILQDTNVYREKSLNSEVVALAKSDEEFNFITYEEQYDEENNEYYLISYKDIEGNIIIGYVKAEDVKLESRFVTNEDNATSENETNLPEEETAHEETDINDQTPDEENSEEETTDEEQTTNETETQEINIESITLSETNITLEPGTTKNISITTEPITDISNLVFTSSNEKVATIDESGTITAKSAGTATITVSNKAKTVTANCRVTVSNIEVAKINIDKSSIKLGQGETYKVAYTISPENATNKTVTLKTNNSKVADVEGDKIVAKNSGTAIITATTNNKKTDTILVTVRKAPTSISLNRNNITLKVNESFDLDSYVDRYSASNIRTFKSSDEKVVIVKNSIIKAVSKGTAIVTVTTYNGKTASCVVTVTDEKIEDNLLSPNNISVLVNVKKKLTTTLENATFKSSNPSVATVDNDGIVIAKKVGTTTITATDNNGNTQTAEIKVIKLPKSIEITNTNSNMKIGSTLQLKVAYNPTDATEKDLVWSSSNNKIITVDQKGLVKAIAPGKATITAKSNSNNSIPSAKITITVDPIKTTDVKFEKDYVNLGLEEKYNLKYNILPSNATNKSVTLSTSDPKVVGVENNSIIAVGKGTATVTITTKDTKKTDTINITVKGKPTRIRLNETNLKIGIGETFDLDSYLDEGQASAVRIYSTSNAKVATATGSIVKGIAPGTATITVKTYNGKTATCNVEVVNQKNKDVNALSPSNVSVILGYKKNFYTTLTGKVTWKSSNTKIATIDENGRVTTLKTGKVVITAQDSKGNKQLANLEVIQIPTSMTVNIKEEIYNLNKTKTITVKPTFSPSDTTEKVVNWTSSDPNVATVDKNGVVTLLKSGKTTITGISASNNKLKTESLIRVVNKSVEGLKLISKDVNIGVGEKYNVSYQLIPEDATLKTVYFKTSDKNIVEIGENNQIIGKKTGDAKVTLTTKDGSKQQILNVKVKNAPVSISLNETSLNIKIDETFDLDSYVNSGSASALRTYSTSNPKIVTVTGSIVKGITPGTATITVKTYNGKTATCQVTVESGEFEPSAVLSPNNISLKVNGTKQLKTTLTGKVTYSSSNTKIAKVDANGLVTAVGLGQAKITAKNSNGAIQTANVEVINLATKIDVNKPIATINIKENKTLKLSVIYTPKDATDKGVTWSSSDEKIATVDKNGTVTAKKVGTVTITAKSNKSSLKATSKIIVVDHVNVTKVDIKGNNSVTAGNSINLTASISPSNATNKNVTWSSSNEKVAKVNSSGKVTGVDGGTATITVKSKDNGKSASYKVTVKDSGNCKISSISASGVTVNYKIKCTGTSSISDTQYKVSNGSFTSRGSGFGAVKSTSGSIKFKNTNAGKSVTLRVYYNGKTQHDDSSVTLKTPSCKTDYKFNVNSGNCEKKTSTTVTSKCSTGSYDSSTKKCVKNVTTYDCGNAGGKRSAPFAENICICSGKSSKCSVKFSGNRYGYYATKKTTKQNVGNPTRSYTCKSGKRVGSGANAYCLVSYTP